MGFHDMIRNRDNKAMRKIESKKNPNSIEIKITSKNHTYLVIR